MSSLRASYPVLKDRFSSYTKLTFGVYDWWTNPGRPIEANGYMFMQDESLLFVSLDGVTFIPIYELYYKITDVAYGDGKYVFSGTDSHILTSEGPDAYYNWNIEEQDYDESLGLVDDFMCVHFDGTAFIVSGESAGAPPSSLPMFQRALPADVTDWTAINGASVPPGETEEVIIWNIDSYGGRMVAVGAAYGEYGEGLGSRDVIQYSDDHGLTWTNVTPPGMQPQGASQGLTELEVTGDGRFVALSSEYAQGMAEWDPPWTIRFIQSTDGATWELINDRLMSPFIWEQHSEPYAVWDVINRSALFLVGGAVLVLLPGMEMQIGRMGADGPDNFEHVPFPSFKGYSKGMCLFKGNYYLEVEPGEDEGVPCYLIAFTPRVPINPADLEWTPHEEYPTGPELPP